MTPATTQGKGIFRLVAYSARMQQGKFLWIILTLLVADVLEGVWMLSLFPVLQLVVDPSSALVKFGSTPTNTAIKACTLEN